MEHRVWQQLEESGGSRIYKTTRPEASGMANRIELGPDGELRIFQMSSTPTEYLRRLAMQDLIFGGDTRFEGLGKEPNGSIGFVHSQPEYVGEHPPMQEIVHMLLDRGFVQIGDPKNNKGFRAEDGVVLSNGHQGNFIRLADGTIHAIELVISQAPAEIEGATRGGN